MANIDPVATTASAAAQARSTMGETQIRISTEAARELSKLAESQGIDRRAAVERMIMTAAGKIKNNEQ